MQMPEEVEEREEREAVDTKRDLCPTCTSYFPECGGDPKFGDGVGLDNVYECGGYVRAPQPPEPQAEERDDLTSPGIGLGPPDGEGFQALVIKHNHDDSEPHLDTCPGCRMEAGESKPQPEIDHDNLGTAFVDVLESLNKLEKADRINSWEIEIDNGLCRYSGGKRSLRTPSPKPVGEKLIIKGTVELSGKFTLEGDIKLYKGSSIECVAADEDTDPDKKKRSAVEVVEEQG